MTHFLWVSKSYWWNIVDKLWTYFMCIRLMKLSHKYDSYNHQIDRIVTGSDVIIYDVTRCWDYRRERPNFSRSVRSISLYRVTKRMWWNFMWLYLIHLTSNDLMWPQWRHVMAIEVECLSRSKNCSVTGSLTVTQTSSIRKKNFTYRVQASKVITKSSDWMKFWPMRAWLEWNLIHRF